jgi:hypothetical protein
VIPGQSVEVVLLFDQWPGFNTYYQYGLLPGAAEPTWYRFLHSSATGAEILDDRIVLHVTDGGRGDGDLTKDGRIVVLGAPGANEHPRPWQNPRSLVDVTDDGLITPLDVLALINEINTNDARLLPVPPVPPYLPIAYFDVTGDNQIAPLDVLFVINDLNTHGSRPVPEGENAALTLAAPNIADSEVDDEVARSTLAAWLAVGVSNPSDLSILSMETHGRSRGANIDFSGPSPLAPSSAMDAWRRLSQHVVSRVPTKRSPAEVDACFEDEHLLDLLSDVVEQRIGEPRQAWPGRMASR